MTTERPPDLAAVRPAGWHPLFSRYGFSTAPRAEHWERRHEDSHRPWQCEETRPDRQCRCALSLQRPECCQEMTAEDLLCDACRAHCRAVDEAGLFWRCVSLPEVGRTRQRVTS